MMPQSEDFNGNGDEEARHLPREVGGYEIQRVLGSGGMATVYAALQKQPRRTVAIKVMRVTAKADTAVRRFRREVEILGRLRHPYIAQVYDAGVHEEAGGSLPYFVMEYVPRAKTIIEFAEAKALSIRDRLKLFAKVCAAIEHGHHRRIIHRDLKPSNILIDEGGEPRIIDFGVARAMEVDLGAQTLHTEEGRLIGTIQYMAPEQLETKRQDLDARCDVYSLGVVLYRLLTGRPAHDLGGLPIFTAAQVVREDAPPRPSLIAAELKGDLETVMLKALAKDRNHRYRTAGSLGRDILRYLGKKPIKARKAGPVYRMRLYARRHRVELCAVGAVAGILIIATAAVLYQRARLNETTRVAQILPPGGGAEGGSGVEEAGSGASVESGEVQEAGGTEPARGQAPPAMPFDLDAWPEPPREFTLNDLSGVITALAFDGSGELLAGGAEDPAVALWRVDDEQALFIATDHDTPARHIGFDATGSLLVTAANDGKIVMVETATGRIRDVVQHGCATIGAMAMDGAGDLLALGCGDLTMRVMGRDGQERQVLRGTSGAFTSAAFSHDGALLAGGSGTGEVYLWDAGTGELLERFDRLRAKVIGIGFDGEDHRLVGVTAKGTGVMWDLDSEEPQDKPFAAGIGDLVAASIDPTGRWLACASTTHVAIMDLTEGAAIGRPLRVDGGLEIRAVAVSPDARWCATGGDGGAVRVEPVAARWQRDGGGP